MPDLSISAAEVALISGREITAVVGEAVTKGQALAFDGSAYYLADNNSGTAARKTISGIALQTATLANTPIRIQKSGVIYLGALLTVSGVYVVSATAGGIAPYSDLATGNEILIVGVGGPKQYTMSLFFRDTGVSYP